MNDIKAGEWVLCNFNYDLCGDLTPSKPYKVIDTMWHGSDFMINILANDNSSRWYIPAYSPTLDAAWIKCDPPQSHYPYIIIVGIFIAALVYFNLYR